MSARKQKNQVKSEPTSTGRVAVSQDLMKAFAREGQKTPAGVLQVAQQLMETHSFQGPIPDPKTAAEYEEILPGVFERMFSLVERRQEQVEQESIHRRELEKVQHERKFSIESRGQAFALIVTLVTMIGAFVLVWHGHEITGGILGGMNITGIALAFLKSSGGSDKNVDSSGQKENKKNN
jgi:uncharacterized membrane protein